jgi:hypothetical protein
MMLLHQPLQYIHQQLSTTLLTTSIYKLTPKGISYISINSSDTRVPDLTIQNSTIYFLSLI